MILTIPRLKEIYINLNEKDIKECREIAIIRSKKDEWTDSDYGKGLLNDDNDKIRTERNGVYGEKAWSLITGLPLDKSYQRTGDKWDFIFSDIKLDIKTKTWDSMGKKDYGKYYIRATNNYGKLQELKSNIYVFATVVYHDGTIKKETEYGFYYSDVDATRVIIAINGIITKEKILEINRRGPAIAYLAKHENYYLQDDELSPVFDFLWIHRHHFNYEAIEPFLLGSLNDKVSRW